MRIRTLIYYIATGFVIGIVTLVWLQYITSSNVHELITGNENLLKEYELSNELVGLQKDLLLFDNKIKTALLTADSNKVKDFRQSVKKIELDLKVLEEKSDSNTSLSLMTQLQRLTARKLDLSQQLVDSFYTAGKPATESAIVTNKAIKLSDDITRLTHTIDTSGRRALAEKVKWIDQSGQRVLTWNSYIIVLVLILLTAVFLIIVSRMKKQAELISQLNTSERKLKEAALVKENFLANMSHEIRTPLNAILGYTSLLQKRKLDEDSKLHVATVHQSGETLLSIVNDILDISKIESGMMRIEEAPFRLSTLIHSVFAMFQHKVEEKGLVFHLSLSEDIPDYLAGDSTRLTQILVNLIGNAIKFTSEGEIRLDIARKPKDSDQVLVMFSVSDTGIGIDAGKLDTIFERFRQAEDSTTRKFGGTGLGLSIVRDLVYLQRGDIEVTSKSGLGTTVVFSIPYRIAQPVVTEISLEKVAFSPDSIRKINVLIVEDNVINQGLMVHMMQEWGVRYKVADNGIQALQMLLEEYFDLVFMDIQMPEMDGYTATSEIRNNLKLTVPIVAMTAHAMAGDREKCLGYGMNEHIAKPIRESDLIRIFSLFFKSDSVVRIAEQDSKSEAIGFEVIDLSYMKEISGGDSAYEKLVTGQFLTLMPAELRALKTALSEKDFVTIKRVAHSMKTSISIMGLDALIGEDLDRLENDHPDLREARSLVDHIDSVCSSALSEASLFYRQF